VTLRLAFSGAGAPAAVARPPRVRERLSPLWLAPAALGLLAFALVRLRRYLAHEQRNGRFAPLPPAESIDDAWLAEHVLKYPPEKIGSLWDDKVGAAEVAAVLARLVQEGKLKSRIDKHGWLFTQDVLYLEIPTPRPALNSYEDALIKALFVDGDSTDTDKIRKHYRREHKPFDPGAILARYLRLNDRVSDANRAAIKGGWKLSAALALVALAALAASVYAESRDEIGPEFVLAAALLGVASVIFYVALSLIGLALRYEVVKPRAQLAALLIVYSVYVGLLLLGAWLASAYLGAPVLVLIAALGALLLNLALNRALTRVSPAHLAERKNLTAARAYFAGQLSRHAPRLQDAWYPYLIAFGLGREMDRWFERFGAESGGTISPSAGTFGRGSSSHGGPAPTWTGGGGTFGGGGASGAWSAAAGAMAAGVTASAAGAGSGGGGGGGGSSGGGGGGGW
jgi:uncharacterized membrane protein YgcG